MYAAPYDTEYKLNTRSILQTWKCTVASSYGTVMKFTSSAGNATNRVVYVLWSSCSYIITYDTKQFLRFHYPRPLTRRKGSVLWPMWSPDVTPTLKPYEGYNLLENSPLRDELWHFNEATTIITRHTPTFWRKVNSWRKRTKLST
jgi:hypothetical protein